MNLGRSDGTEENAQPILEVRTEVVNLCARVREQNSDEEHSSAILREAKDGRLCRKLTTDEMGGGHSKEPHLAAM